MPHEDNYDCPSLPEALSRLAHEIREARQVSAALLKWFNDQDTDRDSRDFNEKQLKRFAELDGSIKKAIQRTEDKIMSQISEFADRVEAKFSEVGTAVDELLTSVSGIDADVKNLKKQITDLQNSPGAVTPEDAAKLDKLEASIASLAQKTAVAAQAVKDLDAQTETAPPVEPPTE